MFIVSVVVFYKCIVSVLEKVWYAIISIWFEFMVHMRKKLENINKQNGFTKNLHHRIHETG